MLYNIDKNKMTKTKLQLISEITDKLGTKNISKTKLIEIAHILCISTNVDDSKYLSKITRDLKADKRKSFIQTAKARLNMDKYDLKKDIYRVKSLTKRKVIKKISDPQKLTGSALYDRIRELIPKRPRGKELFKGHFDSKTQSLLKDVATQEKKKDKQTFFSINTEFQSLILETDPYYQKSRVKNKEKLTKDITSFCGFENNADKQDPLTLFSIAQIKMKKSDKENLLRKYEIDDKYKYAGTLTDIFNDVNALVRKHRKSSRKDIYDNILVPNTRSSSDIARMTDTNKFKNISKMKAIVTVVATTNYIKEQKRIKNNKR